MKIKKKIIMKSKPIYTKRNQPNCTTSDLGCCSALITLGFHLADLDKTNPRRVVFLFQNSEGLGKAINDYWSDLLAVNARSYFDNIKMIKNRIYNG